MTVLIILLIALAVLIALLMLRCNVTVEYRDALRVRISALGISLWQHPKKKKKVKLSYYTPRKFERRKRREAKKAAKKKASKPSKNTAKSSKKRGLMENLGLIRELLGVILQKTAGHARLRARRIIINVATEDAAKTAVLFGAVNQAVIGLLELLDNAKKWRRLKDSEIAVRADFGSQKSSADIEITLSLRVWHLANVLLHTLRRYAKHKRKANKKSNPLANKEHS